MVYNTRQHPFVMGNRGIHSFLSVFVITLLVSVRALAGEEIPGAPQRTPVVITNATVHLGTGEVLQKASIVFDKGVITQVGATVTVPASATVIDAAGKHVYPGFILAGSTLGLIEIDAVRATNDQAEVGSVNPNVTAATAYDPDSELIPTIRSNGILLANVAPEGGAISGRSSLMRMDGWTREDIAVLTPSAMVIDWPNIGGIKPWWSDMSEAEWAKRQREAVEQIESFFREALAYVRATDAGLDSVRRDIRYESMRTVLDGTLPVMVAANTQQQIEAALDFADRYQLRLIVRGGAEADRVADQLKRRSVPVIVRRIHSLPTRDESGYDEAYALPGKLVAAGVTICFEGAGAWRQRDVPFEVGTACAFGLAEEQGVKGLTLSAARVFGIDKTYGSLEVGKSATLFVSAGNALDVQGNIVEQAWIDGRAVDLSNRHKRLSKKYREREAR